MRISTSVLIILVATLWSADLFGQVDARMLQQPDVSKTHIAFVYGGDIWVMPKAGGTASRLTSTPGDESFPRFSPDGSQLAFSANYDGNTELYVIPTLGGEAKRITFHPYSERILDWYPDGTALLFASMMESGRDRFRQFYKISSGGGLPEKLPLPYGEFGSISPDSRLLAYIPIERDFRTWKRYRGGMAPDIWIYDLTNGSARNLTSSESNDSHPMWHGNTLYFLSDRDGKQRFNIWACDLKGEKFRQITRLEDYDIHFPAIGPEEIVFEAGGRLYLLDLDGEKSREVAVRVVTDERSLKPRPEKVSRLIAGASLSPSGKRVLFEARGDVLSVPAEHGVIQNLTRSSGFAERSPAWSPDGKKIAYWSDRTGEYELTVRETNGSAEETTVTSYGSGFRYRAFWSPDSKKVAFIDQAMKIHLLDLETRQTTEVDRNLRLMHGGLASFRLSWSADSRWIAYSRDLESTRSTAVFAYDVEKAERHQVTAGYYKDQQPVFDPEGKYLYYLSDRSLTPYYSDFDNSWVYANSTHIVALALRPDVVSPLAARDDREEAEKSKDDKSKDDKSKPDNGEKEEKTAGAQEVGDENEKAAGEGPKKEAGKAPAKVEIDFTDIERRAVILPPPAGNYGLLESVAGKVVYLRLPRTGAPREEKPALVFYDLKERKEETVAAGVNQYSLSANGEKALVAQGDDFAILDLKPNQKIEKKLRTAEMETTVDPRSEWRQIFNDAWRFERDYFYDPNMHGVDWKAVRVQYGKLLDDVVSRSDLNFVLGEMIGELNASHAYRGGGDLDSPNRRGVGLLGIDWALENGAYRIERILRGGPWDFDVRSPLAEPGLKVKEGDYILAVNGIPLDAAQDPRAAFQGLAKQTAALTVNDRPTNEGAWEVLVQTIDDESELRYRVWIEEKRLRVDAATGGRVAYVYVPNTGRDGQAELVRQLAAQIGKEGLIVDERFNSGGQIPDRFVEFLNRPPLSYWATRDGQDWAWPPVAHFGPKVMLINGWSGSGGDAFPFYFREAGLGPLIGARTWGGLIGMSGSPRLIDGGVVTVPTFRMYGTDGTWFQEGHGVDPDIAVVDDPSKGGDPQLERAIEEIMRRLREKPYKAPHRPAYEDRTARN